MLRGADEPDGGQHFGAHLLILPLQVEHRDGVKRRGSRMRAHRTRLRRFGFPEGSGHGKEIVAAGLGNSAADPNLAAKIGSPLGLFRSLGQDQASDPERRLFYVNPYKSKGQSSKSKNGGGRQDYNSLKTMAVRQRRFGVLVAKCLCSADCL